MTPRLVHTERRKAAGNSQARHQAARYSALIIVNAACEVVSTFVEVGSHEATRFLAADGMRLLPELEAAVRTMIEAMERSVCSETLLLLVADRAMRLSPLKTASSKQYALVIEMDGNEHRISRAASRYSLTRRQIEVLLLVLEGANAGEVARALDIAEYTAQGHIKALLVKTGSRNRAAMISNVLDWSTRPARARETAALRVQRIQSSGAR